MSPNTKPTKPIDIYVRVSDDEGRDVEKEGGSAAEQERRARAALESKGYLVGEVRKDIDISGGKESRPGFDELLERIEAGVSGGLIVKDLSRFGRHKRVEEQILDIEAQGGTVILLDDNIDTSTPSGRLLLGFMTRLNNYYLELSGEAYRRAQEQAVERGVKISRIPFGYVPTYVGTDKTGKAIRGPLAPDSKTASYVTEAFERRAQGETYESIAVWLEGAGVEKKERRETKDGVLVEADPVPWDYRQVMDLLSREVYRGHVVHGSFRKENAHPALVDEETWLRVRARNGKPATKATTSAKGTHLLTGYIRCAGCGKAMAYSKSAPRGKVYYFCRCKRSACTDKAGIAPVELEAYVANVLAQAVAVEIVKPRRNEERLAAARARRDRAEAELLDFESTWQEQGIGASAAAKVIDSLEAALEEAEQAITEIPNDEAEDATWARLRQQLKDSSSEVVVQLLRDQPVVFPGMLPSVSEDEIEQLVEGAKGRTEQLVETGLAGADLLEALLLPVAKLRQDAPELAEQLFQTKRLILKRFLSKVTVSGKGGPAEGRVDVELKA